MGIEPRTLCLMISQLSFIQGVRRTGFQVGAGNRAHGVCYELGDPGTCPPAQKMLLIWS